MFLKKTLLYATGILAVVFMSVQPVLADIPPLKGFDDESERSVGLVLSGGGARGFAHIGALKALEELNVPVTLVTGTSMGAMVGGAYAAGYSADDIRQITLGVNWRRMFAPRAERSDLSWRRKDDDRKGLGVGELGISDKGLTLPAEVVPTQELDIFLSHATEPVNAVNDLSRLSLPFAAMATDLESGKRVVMQKNVTLSLAMRASMSVPGAFAPVNYNGRLLVDGGLVDNLPVCQAREMGAKLVIAVNVGTPLSKREQLSSIVGVMGQVVNILTEQNVQASIASLGPQDIFITPDLEAYSSGDFHKAREIIAAGYEAVMKHKEALQALSVEPQAFQQWQIARASHVQNSGVHDIARVEVRGLKRVNPEKVIADIDLDTSKPVDNETIAQAARHVWADGDFQSVPFRFEPGPRGTEVLVFEPAEKEWGYSSLRFGGNLQTDFKSHNSFNVLLAHTWGWLNDWGAEWRTELQAGEIKRAMTEWYQPLGPSSSFFLRPRISYEWEPFEVYLDTDTPVARYRNERFDVGVSLGYELARFGELSAGVGFQDLRTKGEITLWSDKAKVTSAYGKLELSIDTLDHASFPREGLYLDASVTRYVGAHVEGEELTSTVYAGSFLAPVAIGKDWSVVFGGKLGRSNQAGNFNLGGVFNLSGSPYGRYAGSNMALGRVIVMNNISRTMKELGMPVYVGASFEMGRAWDDSHVQWSARDDKWREAASVYVAVDSLIGPIYLVAGRTFGAGSTVTLYWGRLQ